jgi:hypothetical protein
MSKTVVVRYKTRPDAAQENLRLVEAVYLSLQERQPQGLRYATFQLSDGVTFVHVAVVDGDVDPLGELPAFAAFQRGVGDRLTEGPEAAAATLVGSYRFLAGG